MAKNKIDPANFAEVVNEYHTLIFRTAMGFVHSKEDAEDLTQETFIKAFQNIHKFRGDSEISTWLYRIVVNLSLNHISQKKKKGWLSFSNNLLQNIFTLKTSDDPNPQQKIECDERDMLIQDAIDQLPDKQRTAFILYRYDDLSQKQVADIMNISEGAVEQLLLRAKNNLQKKLQQTIGKPS